MSIKGRVTAARDSWLCAWVGLFGSCEKFFGVGFVVLAFGDAGLACAVARLAAVETERAGVVFAVGCGVRAGHETE